MEHLGPGILTYNRIHLCNEHVIIHFPLTSPSRNQRLLIHLLFSLIFSCICPFSLFSPSCRFDRSVSPSLSPPVLFPAVSVQPCAVEVGGEEVRLRGLRPTLLFIENHSLAEEDCLPLIRIRPLASKIIIYLQATGESTLFNAVAFWSWLGLAPTILHS